ncbi:MAG: hypothetical protein ABSB19_02665 [Methylomonas sp.]
MFKKILITAMVMAIPFSVSAAAPDGPDKGGPGWHEGKRMEYMSKELGLSDDQKIKLEAIMKTNHEKFKAMREENDKQVEAILTKDQIAKYEEMKKKHHEKWKSRHEGEPAKN